MESAAYLAGSLHDMGKFKTEFQDYLMKASHGENVIRGSVIHTFAGVKYILENYWKSGEATKESIISEIIAYAIGAHHSLFDIEGEEGKNGFTHRISSDNIKYEESVSNFQGQFLSRDQVDELMKRAVNDLWPLIEKMKY